MRPVLIRRLQPIALVILIFFTWFCIEPWNYAVWAQSSSNQPSAFSDQGSAFNQDKRSSAKFEEALRATKKAIEDLDQRLSAGKDITKTLASLQGHKQILESSDLEIRGEFKSTEAFLKEKGLPAIILDRHAKAMADYDSNYKKLKDNLSSIERLEKERSDAEKRKDKAKDKAKVEELKKRIKDSKTHLKEKVKEPPKIPLDPNNLPHRTPKIKPRKPRLKKEEFTELNNPIQLAFNGDPYALLLVQNTQDIPTAADLSETIEVQFTQEIKDLAASLDHNPVKIYNFVRNNIDFIFVWGSMQGAGQCLLTGQCNAFDTASLLIALLRASGIPARYVMGTIEIPIDQATNWAGGFTDADSALRFIWNGGAPAESVISGGKIVAIDIEHIWVEAYIPYGNYRGTIGDQSNKTWIPMDASFKQFEYTAGLDIARNVSFDKSAYLSKFNNINPIDFYLQQIQAYIDLNLPGKTIEDIKRIKTIKEEDLGILSPTLPYRVLVRVNPSSAISDIYRNKVIIKISDPNIGPVFTYLRSVPAILGKRLTVSYIPSTQADQQLITQYGGFYNVPAYLLKVKPAIKLEGDIVAQGSSISQGSSQELYVGIIRHGDIMVDQAFHNIKAGGYYAIGLDPKGASEGLMEKRFDIFKNIDWGAYSDPYTDPILGEFLYISVLRYFNDLERSKDELSEVIHYLNNKDISEGLTGFDLNVDSLFGAPSSITPSTEVIDVAREIISLFPIDGIDNKKQEMINLLGMDLSFQESRLWEKMIAGSDAISAVKTIQLASEAGIPIHHINQGNITQELSVLSVAENVKESIRNAVNQGKVVTIPQTNIQRNFWNGVGWIVEDPVTGAGAYLISGGINGSQRTNFGIEGENPDCGTLGTYLGDDIYKAIAYQESKWAQFIPLEARVTNYGDDYGLMQINEDTWNPDSEDNRKEKEVPLFPGTINPVNWNLVLTDWQYNADLGKAIYNDELKRAELQLNGFGKNFGITPTAEQIRLQALAKYNGGGDSQYYTGVVKDENGNNVLKKNDCTTGKTSKANEACKNYTDYADKANAIFKNNPWAVPGNLTCNKRVILRITNIRIVE